MQTCTQCGAQSPPEAKWCGSCYLMFVPPSGAANGVIAAALPPAGPDVRIPPQTPIQVAVPAVTAPPTQPFSPAPPSQVVPAQPTAAHPPPWPAPAMPPAMPPAMLPPGWAPPPHWAPPAGGGPVAGDPVAEGRLLSGRALAIVAISIGLGAIYQGIVTWMAHDPHIGIGKLTRWNIVLNIGVYAVVGALVLSQITPSVRLRWGDGSRLARIGFGSAFGLGGGVLVTAAVSSAHHALSTDPRAIQMMGAGDATHILVTVLLVCLAAPLVEETLFRGLFLESLRRYGRQAAIAGSALCFAVWHLNKEALIYYTAMGCVFGAIYLKRGLLSSMSAHAAFNGTLTVVGLIIVLGPAHTYDVGGLRVTVPGGWTKEDTQFGSQEILTADSGTTPLLLDGPDSSGMGMFDLGVPATPFDPDQAAEHLQQLNVPLPAGSSFDTGSVREVPLPTVGTAVEVNLTYHSSSGEMAFFAYDGEAYLMLAVTGDSSKAASDFTRMLDSLQPA